MRRWCWLAVTLTTYTKLERDSKLKALQTRQDGSWTDLLPSIGVAYTPSGHPRPAASWSPLQILDRRDSKRKAKLDRESIILTYELILTDRIYKLNQLYHDYMIDLEALKAKKEALTIDEKLFEITERKYQELKTDCTANHTVEGMIGRNPRIDFSDGWPNQVSILQRRKRS